MSKGKQFGFNLNSANAVYLYPDGHAVVVRAEKHPKFPGRTIDYAEVHENIGAKCTFEGRLALTDLTNSEGTRGPVNLLPHLKEIKVENGKLHLISDAGWDMILNDKDNSFFLEEDENETFAEVQKMVEAKEDWQNYPIYNVKTVEQAENTTAKRKASRAANQAAKAAATV